MDFNIGSRSALQVGLSVTKSCTHMNLAIHKQGDATPIKWNSSLSVGINEIDDQHKEMVELMNELHRSLKQKRSPKTSLRIFHALVQSTQIHFSVEESLMRIFGYPDHEEHKHHHNALMAELKKLKPRINNWQLSDDDLLPLLKTSLTRHFMEEDKDYSTFLQNKGLKQRNKTRSLLNLFS